MKLRRRQFLHLTASAAALPALPWIARAQTYPSHPITMIIPIAAGSISDVAGRVVVERMRVSLGQPIIIENVSGGAIQSDAAMLSNRGRLGTWRRRN
jgi:tripartite-type tricarboxylate transporter receptor subunit TctC